MPTQKTTPLLSDHQGLPLHIGSTRTHDCAPISVRVCHSASSWPSQRDLVLVRFSILAHFTGLGPILVRSRTLERVAARTPWSIIFDFTTVSFLQQWLWYFSTFVSSGLLKSLCLVTKSLACRQLSSSRHYRQSAYDDDNNQHLADTAHYQRDSGKPGRILSQPLRLGFALQCCPCV